MTEYLIDTLSLDESLVQTARRRTEEHGGDFVSQLLVMDVVEEAELLTALADAYECSAAEIEDYERVQRDALETLDVEALRAHRIIPFRKHRRSLAVFVVEPLDAATVEELAEEYDVTLSQFVWPGLRYEEALHTLLDEPLPDWIRPFFARTEHKITLVESDTGRLGANSSATQITLEELGDGWTTRQTLTFIENCFDRDALLHTLLGFSKVWLANRMVLVLGSGYAQPYLIDGWSERSDESLERDALRKIKIEVPEDAVLFDEKQVGHSIAERPEEVGLGQLFVELTLFPPERLLVQTVRIGKRPSMAVIGEPHHAKRLPSVEPLELVARAVGDQLEEIVRLAKAKRLPPEGERIPAIPDPEEYADEEDDRPAVPGIAEVSDSISDAEEADAPNATAFGIPFADDEDPSRKRQPSAVQVSSPGVSEDSNVSIMAPVDVKDDEDVDEEEDDVRRTLSGGFSVTELQKPLNEEDEHEEDEEAQDSEEEATEADDAPEEKKDDSGSAKSKANAPMAQILRPVSLKEGRKQKQASESEPAELQADGGHASAQAPVVDAVEAAEPTSDDDEEEPVSLANANSRWTLSFGSPPDDDEDDEDEETAADAVSEPEEDPSEADEPVEEQDEEDPSGENEPEEGELEEEQDEEEEPEADTSDDEELVELEVEPVDADEEGEGDADQEGEDDSDEYDEAANSEEADLSGTTSSFSEDLLETASELDGANPQQAFAAAERLASFGETAMQLLEDRFPGRLFVDRYQYPIDTLPPVREHGPVLAALAASGETAVPVTRSFLEHTSVELRFYATYLFTQLPVADAVEELIPRLFDRDQQTREVAKTIVLDSRQEAWFSERVLPLLHDELEVGTEDLRVEVAAELLGRIRDRDAIPHLIAGLEKFEGRVKERIHQALRKITYKNFVPSVSEWKNWWTDATSQTRYDWLIAALNSSSLEIRELAFGELQQIDGLELNYHPDQPAKLRGRAQENLREWVSNRE